MKDILEKEKNTIAEDQETLKWWQKGPAINPPVRSFRKLLDLSQDGDRFELRFLQKIEDPKGMQLGIFLPGKVYDGFVKKSTAGTKIILKHEYVPFYGAKSEFSKKEFIDNLKKHGKPCEVINCYNSYIYRGEEKKAFAEAILELFGPPRSKSELKPEFKPKPKVKPKPRPRPEEDEDKKPGRTMCDEFDFKINKLKGRKHGGRKKAKFIVTGKKEFQGKSEGNFKHYEQKFLNEMGICSFDEFYDAIEDCFGPEWQDKVLAKHGMDYYFRNEHEIAYKILLINEDEGTCPTKPENKDKAPILDPDHKSEGPDSTEECEKLLSEWNEIMFILTKVKFATWFLKKENAAVDDEAVKAEREREGLPKLELVDNPRDIILADEEKAGDRLLTAEEWDKREETMRAGREIEIRMKELNCPDLELSFNPKEVYDDIRYRLPKVPKPELDPEVPIPTLAGELNPREYDRKDLDVRSGAKTPSVHIDYGRNYMIYGHEDPLNNYPQDGNRYILDDKLKELFGYNGWKKYRQENLEDLRKEIRIMGKDGEVRTGKQRSLRPGDITLSAPTLWPIHVAMALEEFANLYEAEPEQYLPVLLFDSAEQRNEARIRAEKLDIALPDESTLGAMTDNERKLLEKRFGLTGLGDAAGQGAFEMGVRNPFEGLLEGGQNALGKAFAAMKARSSRMGPVQVTDKNGDGLYWIEGDPGPDLTLDVDGSKRQNALNALLKELGALRPGSTVGRRSIEVPENWREKSEFEGLAEYRKIMDLPPSATSQEEAERWARGDELGSQSSWLVGNQRSWDELSREERVRVLKILRIDVEQSESRPTVTSDVSTLERASTAGYKFEKLMVDPSDGIQMAGIVPLKAGPIIIPGTDLELGNVYFFPKKGVRSLTKAEDILFKRLGVKNSEFQEKGFIYLMNLDTKETNVFRSPNYEVSSEEDPMWDEADRWREKLGERVPPTPPEGVVDKPEPSGPVAGDVDKPAPPTIPEDPTLKVTGDMRQEALDVLVEEAGGKWIWDEEEGEGHWGVPDDWPTRPEFKEIAEYHKIMVDKQWEDLPREGRERALEILKIDAGKIIPTRPGEAPGVAVPRPPEDVIDPGYVEEPLPPEVEVEPTPEEEDAPGPLVPIEKPIPDEEINEELGLVRFNGFKRVRPASHTAAFGQPIAIDFLKGLANVNDGHWRIGDISRAAGGRFPTRGLHSSHQTGLDIDIGIPMAKGRSTIFTKDERPERFAKSSRGRPHAAKRGWDYSKGHIVSTEQIEKILDLVGAAIDASAIVIYIDKSIGDPIKEMIRNKIADGSLDPKYKIAGKKGRGLIQHWSNHEDHFHIRFPFSKEVCSGPECNSTYRRDWNTPEKVLAYKKARHGESRRRDENLNLSDIFSLINEVFGEDK